MPEDPDDAPTLTRMVEAWYNQPPGSFILTDEEAEDEAEDMARVLAVVRSHDAARVPADAELDEAQSRASSYTYETATSGGAVNLGEVIAALRRRVAALEAERDKLRRSFKAACGEADHFKRAFHEALGVDLAPSDAQEGRADG